MQQFKAITSHHCYLGEELNTDLTATSFLGVWTHSRTTMSFLKRGAQNSTQQPHQCQAQWEDHHPALLTTLYLTQARMLFSSWPHGHTTGSLSASCQLTHQYPLSPPLTSNASNLPASQTPSTGVLPSDQMIDAAV